MTEQEKEELRRKIEARKQREATERAGNMNNNQKTCPGCGSVIPANYDVCPICGEVLRQGVKPKQQIQSNDSDKGQGLATASLVLGIVGVALSLLGLVLSLWMCIPGLICSIAGLVTAKKAKKNGCVSGIRTAGFILSIIAVVLGGIGLAIMIFRIVVLVELSATFGNTSVPDGTKTIDQLGGGTGF